MNLLIDALYVNSGGGLVLLEELIRQFHKLGIFPNILIDKRCASRFLNVVNCTILSASMYNRRLYYKKHHERFESVLCFGNIPPPMKVKARTYTYFHNINLLTLSEANSLVAYWKSWLKRMVYKRLRSNTDFWIVQTTNTQKVLVDKLCESLDRTLIYPFYKLPPSSSVNSSKLIREDYVLIGDYYNGSKGHDELIEAWKYLHMNGIEKVLHLTIDVKNPQNKRILAKVDDALQNNVKIINHGWVPYDEVLKIYSMCKAIVYPSRNESLGLGLIEAMEVGCDVIASDLPFTHSVCVPSEVFDCKSSKSISDAVTRYERGNSPRSSLKIHNCLYELITEITR